MVTISGELLRFIITSVFLLVGMNTLFIIYIIDRLAGTRVHGRKTDTTLSDLKKDFKDSEDACEDAGSEISSEEYVTQFTRGYEERIKSIKAELDNITIDKSPPAPIEEEIEYVDGIPLVDIYDTETSHAVDAGAEIITEVQEQDTYIRAHTK